MSAEPNVQSQTTADPALPPSSPKLGEIKSNQPIPEMPGVDKGAAGDEQRHVSLSKFPTDVKSLINTTDSTIDHLAKLLKSPGGLASFLSTTNYGLYIAAHLHSTAPSRAEILGRLASLLGRTPPKIAPAVANPTAPASPLIPLALTLGDLRTTLRLTGLIPLYVLLKSLIKSKERDTVAYTIKLTQCLSYMTFQLLENIYHLTNKTVISSTWTNARFSKYGGHAKLMTWSCRAWMMGVACDFLRLGREAQVARQTGSYARLNEEEKRSVDKKWWSELFVATSWFPMAVHYSVEGGIGLNLGTCGFMANLANFLKLWEAAK